MQKKMANFFSELLRTVPTKKIKNPANDTFLFITDDINEWVKESSLYIDQGHTLVSPGGIALQCSITRQAVYNWYFRDRKVTAFVCRPKLGFGSDSYVLVDLDQAKKIATNVIKRR